MSRFIVSRGSYFDPFTYDELSKPVQQSAEAHAATADAYEQLSMQTEALGRYISENEGDTQAKALYDNYLNKLNTLQENLWNNGYNARARRDLSSARAAYANDITRLQSAIQSRQERSKEYWDARHKDPTLVAGFDPGLGGLDNYLNNSEYGRDWFSYSGKEFANEVGADLKARALELQNSYINRGMKVPGYLEYVIQNGFSNNDINHGGMLARAMLSGVEVNQKDYTDADRLIASVLLNHLSKTGAKPGEGGNISVEEFNRLFNYGLYGASQGVMAPKRDMIRDEQWHLNADFAKMNHQAKLSEEAAVRKFNREHPNPVDIENPERNRREYSLNQIANYVAAQNAADYNQMAQAADPLKNPVSVNVNGVARPVSNKYDAREVFDAIGARDLLDRWGFDPEDVVPKRNGRDGNKLMVDVSEGGNEVRLRYVRMKNNEKKEFGLDGDYDAVLVQRRVPGRGWVDDRAKTVELNTNYYQPYMKARRQLQKDNKGVDIDGLSLSGKNKQKIYDDLGLPNSFPSADVGAVAMTLGRQENVVPATIAGSGDDMKEYRTDLANNLHMSDVYGTSSSGKKGISKTGTYAYYPVVEGGSGFAKEGVTDPAKVYGHTGASDNTPVDYNVLGIQAYPEDIIKNNKVRVFTKNGVWGVNPARISSDVDAVVKNMRTAYRDQNGDIIDSEGLLHFLTLPVGEDAASIWSMPADVQAEWIAAVDHYLGDYFDVFRADGTPIRPIDIVRDIASPYSEDLQGQFYSAVVNFMDDIFQDPRDWNLLHPQPHASGSVSKKELKEEE